MYFIKIINAIYQNTIDKILQVSQLSVIPHNQDLQGIISKQIYNI